MGDVKALDHIDTGMIESRGYKLIKEFLAGPEDDVLEIHTEAIAYAENLADTHKVGVRPLTKNDQFCIDVYILE